MRQKIRVELELEIDPDEIVGGVRVGTPDRWNWSGIRDTVGIPGLQVLVTGSYLACCEARIDWARGEDDGYDFEPWDHDATCPNFVGIEDELFPEETGPALYPEEGAPL